MRPLLQLLLLSSTVAAIVPVAACGPPDGPGTADAPESPAGAQVRATVRAYYSQFQEPDFEVDELMAFYTDDVVFTDPTFEIEVQGKEEVRRLYASLGTDSTNYAGMEWDLTAIVSEDESVVIRGRWRGSFYACPFDVDFVTLWRLRDGLIAEQTDFFAAHTWERQVGWDSALSLPTCETSTAVPPRKDTP